MQLSITEESARRNGLRDIIGNLRPLYYAGAGIVMGYFAQDLNWGEFNFLRTPSVALGYTLIENKLRRKGNKMDFKELVIIYLGCFSGQMIRNVK